MRGPAVPAWNAGASDLALYYPECPAQATTAERKAVYDALVSITKAGKGGLKVRFDALWCSRQGPSGTELTTCNIYFALPLDKMPPQSCHSPQYGTPHRPHRR
jgi:hypothetical protein